MKLIVITTEQTHPKEAEAINQLFKAGLSCLHLRKPSWSAEQTSAFLLQIEERYRMRIVLHDHYALVNQFQLKGIHLNARNSGKEAGLEGAINSASAHSFEELKSAHSACRYIFLSPIFDSISKQNYPAQFSHKELSSHAISKHIVALGGITNEKIVPLSLLGFGGVAVVGALWGNWTTEKDTAPLLARYRSLQESCNKLRPIPKLHYISSPQVTTQDELLSECTDMLTWGCPLVQVRHKKLSSDSIRQVANSLQPFCAQQNKTLIINDNPLIALQTDADGVHLGKSDMPVAEARALLGNNFLIGGTANTFDDIKRLVASGVDYIGLGPFRFTTTKDNLSPILGLAGYEQILQQCKADGITTPIVAIGGITTEDMPPIMTTGVHGIAISSGLHSTTESETKQHIQTSLHIIQSS